MHIIHPYSPSINCHHSLSFLSYTSPLLPRILNLFTLTLSDHTISLFFVCSMTRTRLMLKSKVSSQNILCVRSVQYQLLEFYIIMQKYFRHAVILGLKLHLGKNFIAIIPLLQLMLHFLLAAGGVLLIYI